MLFAVLILVVGVLGGSVTGLLLHRRTAGPSVSTSTTPPPSVTPSLQTPIAQPSTPSPSSPSSATPSATPTLSAAEKEQRAAAELERLAKTGLATAKPDGQFVAQLAGKYIGITDAQQTTASGSHTFNAVDILAEYRANKIKAEALGATVVLIKGTDIEKGRDPRNGGKVFWFTFALEFATLDEAQDFCGQLYPKITGTALKNKCLAATLKP